MFDVRHLFHIEMQPIYVDECFKRPAMHV